MLQIHYNKSLDLDLALTLLTQISVLYHRLTPHQQKSLVEILFDEIVVYQDGNIIDFNLLPPFSFIDSLSQSISAGENIDWQANLDADFLQQLRFAHKNRLKG